MHILIVQYTLTVSIEVPTTTPPITTTTEAPTTTPGRLLYLATTFKDTYMLNSCQL